MALTDITRKIEQDAEELKARILRDAEQESEEMLGNARARMKQEAERFEKETERLLAENRERVESAARRAARTQRQDEQHAFLVEVFAEARERLLSLSDDEYMELLQKLMKHLPKNVSGTILTPKEKVSLTETAAKNAGLEVTIETTDALQGGFIYRESNAEYNFSFDRLLEDTRSETETKVAEILFS